MLLAAPDRQLTDQFADVRTLTERLASRLSARTKRPSPCPTPARPSGIAPTPRRSSRNSCSIGTPTIASSTRPIGIVVPSRSS